MWRNAIECIYLRDGKLDWGLTFIEPWSVRTYFPPNNDSFSPKKQYFLNKIATWSRQGTAPLQGVEEVKIYLPYVKSSNLDKSSHANFLHIAQKRKIERKLMFKLSIAHSSPLSVFIARTPNEFQSIVQTSLYNKPERL